MLVYICSRYRADDEAQFKKQLEYTKLLAKEQVLLGNDVIVPHLYYPRFLDDDNEYSHTLGTSSAIRLMNYCDTVVVGIKYGISEGMSKEIEVANVNNILIKEVM